VAGLAWLGFPPTWWGPSWPPAGWRLSSPTTGVEKSVLTRSTPPRKNVPSKLRAFVDFMVERFAGARWLETPPPW